MALRSPDEIARRLPRTLELIVVAGLLAVLFGIPGGLLAAVRRGGMLDRVGTCVSALALAVPVFVVGTLLVLLFAQTLRWVPAGGYVPLARTRFGISCCWRCRRSPSRSALPPSCSA